MKFLSQGLGNIGSRKIISNEQQGALFDFAVAKAKQSPKFKLAGWTPVPHFE